MVKARNEDGTFASCSCGKEDKKSPSMAYLNAFKEICYWLLLAIGFLTVVVVVARNLRKIDGFIEGFINLLATQNSTTSGEGKRSL